MLHITLGAGLIPDIVREVGRQVVDDVETHLQTGRLCSVLFVSHSFCCALLLCVSVIVSSVVMAFGLCVSLGLDEFAGKVDS